LTTWKRKFVDWEIHATLEKQHALLGIVLPTQVQNAENRYSWPERLFDNLRSGFAHWMYWNEDAGVVASAVSEAKRRAANASLIVNNRPQMGRNLS
jgi:hypothetical protein